MDSKVKTFFSSKKNILIILVLFALAASIQSLLLERKTYDDNGFTYNQYNNYTIFEKSFHHLNEGKDLYILYPEEQWDLYKYSPTFSVFFGMFAIFPDWIGLNLWNILNALALGFAIYFLPKISNYQKGIILILCLIELMTSMQNQQSNALIAGLIILAFGLLEKDKAIWATLCLVFSVYIKLFGLVGFALFLFYPKKIKFILYSVFWAVFLFVLPLIFVSVDQYIFLFKSWQNMLSNDLSASYGYSVMGWFQTWFGYNQNKLYIVLVGVILFLIPLLKIKLYNNYWFRYLALASILLWVVIFNHKAESPTFIIAMSGAALWFIISKKNPLNITLFVLAFIFTSLSPTDIFPPSIRYEYVVPYTLKGVPCILIWIKLIYDMMRFEKEEQFAIEAPEN